MGKGSVWEIFLVPTMIEHMVPENSQAIKVLRSMANAHSFVISMHHL
jgi:hypothetical protein